MDVYTDAVNVFVNAKQRLRECLESYRNLMIIDFPILNSMMNQMILLDFVYEVKSIM